MEKRRSTLKRGTRAEAERALQDIDWARIDALTDADIAAASRSDPDARDTKALPSEAASVVWPAPDIRELRNRLGLTQRQFALRFGIPKRSLENWEQGRRIPDLAVNIYLQLIAQHPGVIAALVQETKGSLSKSGYPRTGEAAE